MITFSYADRLSLESGWSLVGVDSSLTLDELKIKIGLDNLLEIQGQNKSYKKVYLDDGKDFLNNFTAFETGKGYWVKVDSAIDIDYIKRTYVSEQTIDLIAGWNLIDPPSDLNISNILLQLGSNLEVIQGMNTTYQKVFVENNQEFLNNFQNFEEPQGYWIKVLNDTTLTFPFLADTTKPIITLVGESEVTLSVGERYFDEGATAIDDIDGDISSNIITTNPVDTTKAGSYVVTYNVVDKAGNSAIEVSRVVTVYEVNSNNTANIYEDAEDQKTDKWTLLSNVSNEALVLNTYDDERDSRVIYLNAVITDNNYISYDTFKFDGIDDNKTNRFIQWSMKFNQVFTISINITTDKGIRWIDYIPKDTGAGIYNDRIIHGIGSNKTNDKWYTITRDLDKDLKRYELDNNFVQINYITIRGGGYIDNIKSYEKEDNLDITEAVIVTKPGIVLTFDDSYVENWNDMQSNFKAKGAVATFFCNRWASNQNWNLSSTQVNLLKDFRDNGHEIAYHTSDHLSTRDAKYDNETDKAQAYLDDQIIPGVAYMRNEGFEPTSFSYPYISGQPAHNELIRQELPHIRAFFAHVTLTDEPGGQTLDDIRIHLEKLKEEKDIGVFLSHWIHYVGINDEESELSIHKYKITEEMLLQIMDMVNELGLEFYTLEEAHNIYMNQ
jgi:peptidoglycan/xylan/chitin deacetylase (PgdA/CDA1 family)